MKIKISKDALTKQLTFLQTGLPSKGIIEYDSAFHFSIDADKEHCVIKLCNSQVEMFSLVKVSATENVEFCTPAFLMARTVATFPDGDINITLLINDKDQVKAIELKPEGQRKKYKIACHEADRFPHWPELKDEPIAKFKMNMAVFHQKMNIVGPNVDSRDVRDEFSNITFFSNEGKLMIIAGSSFILAYLTTDIDFPEDKIISRGITKYISTLSENGECEIEVTKNNISVRYGSNKIKTVVHNVKAPRYDKLFSVEPSDYIEVNKNDFQQTLKRLLAFSAGEDQAITIEVKGKFVKLYSRDESNEAEEFLDAQNKEGVEFKCAIKHHRLAKTVSYTDSETIRLSLLPSKSNLFIRPVNDKHNQLWMIGCATL